MILSYAKRFAALLKTGKQVVILIAGYDKPLLQTMYVNEALNEEYRKC